jgi:hypothetical protein
MPFIIIRGHSVQRNQTQIFWTLADTRYNMAIGLTASSYSSGFKKVTAIYYAMVQRALGCSSSLPANPIYRCM